MLNITNFDCWWNFPLSGHQLANWSFRIPKRSCHICFAVFALRCFPASRTSCFLASCSLQSQSLLSFVAGLSPRLLRRRTSAKVDGADTSPETLAGARCSQTLRPFGLISRWQKAGEGSSCQMHVAAKGRIAFGINNCIHELGNIVIHI